MTDTIDDLLKQDIDAFFIPRTHDYLQKCLKRAKASQKLFSSSHALTLIRAFEQEIDYLQSPEPPVNDFQATLSTWKKTFTRNILVPKYLVHDPHMDIEHVIAQMKEALYAACIEVKTESYVRSFRQTIVNSLRLVPPLERMRKARQILTSSIKVVEKLEKNISAEKLLSAFAGEKLEDLIKEAATPLPATQQPADSGTPENRLIKKRVRPSVPKVMGLDSEKLEHYLKNQLTILISEKLNASSTLLAKLQIVSSLLADKETRKEQVAKWLEEWPEKPDVKMGTMLSVSLETLPELIKRIRAEVLARSCVDEMRAARGQTTPQTYAQMHEDILQRYIRSYLQEPQLKELFLAALREEERTERERFLPPNENLEPPSPKSPGKKSLWQRV